MKLQQFISATCGILILSLLTACGGGAALQPGANKPVQQQPVLDMNRAGGAATIASGSAPDYSVLEQSPPADIAPSNAETERGISSTGLDPALLPPLPPLKPATPASLARSASLAEIPVDLGNFYDNANCTPATGNLALNAPAGDVSWALYEVPLERYAQPFNISVNGSVANKEIWLGVSNYARGTWQFSDPPLTLPGGAALFTYSGFGAYRTGAATYVLVLTHDTGAGTITGLRLRTEDVIPSALPPEWVDALNNAGLPSTTPGLASVFGTGINYGSFAWTGYDDLQTMLPIFWSAWYGEPGATDYPEYGSVNQFPTYVRDMSDRLEDTVLLQDMFREATNQFPLDKRGVKQESAPTLDPADPLAVALADFINATGSTADLPGLKADCAPMPLDQQSALAEVVMAAQTALEQRQAQIDDVTTTFGFTDEDWDNLFDYTHGGPTGLECLIAPTGAYSPIVYNSNNLWLRGWPYPEMLFNGTALIADAIDNLTLYIHDFAPGWTSINVNVATQGGQVTISGTGDDTHGAPGDGNGHAILIDLGGNDTYNCHAGGTASIDNGVALCLDLGGDDTYNRLDDPDDGNRNENTDDNTSQQGAGRYGIGILVDFAGNDNYYSVRLSQGSAIMGAGILADYAGIDSYNMEALGQGAALGGVGLLWDRNGADVYTGWSKVQGCGLMMGVGFLADSGDAGDTYYCEPAENVNKPEYYADAYSTNMTIGQGCGWGARWGWLPESNTGSSGTVGSGGFGLLFDGGGTDAFTCGTFGMGCGFYQGLGLLIDRSGDDVRSGHWYTGGATAHAAAAMLWDADGNDTYDNNVSIGLGGAHDWSLSWFIDRHGNDTYDAGGAGPGLRLFQRPGLFHRHERR